MSHAQDSSPESHWQSVYGQKTANSVSWYREHLDVSLDLLTQAGLSPTSRIIDVGGGASTLVDDLLDRSVGAITVLDLSAAALAIARERLGDRADRVTWLTGDITIIALPERSYTHWHDRAVMHFLTRSADVEAYCERAARAIVPGGYAMIGGFAPDGPERCSGLPVARRSPQDVAEALAPWFALVDMRSEQHRTPGGAGQSFAYALLRRAQ